MKVRSAVVIASLVALLALPGAAFGATMYYPTAPALVPQMPKIPIAAPKAPPPQNFGLAKATYVPAGVNSAGVYVTPETTSSKLATPTYNLDWTIGTAGKSGCMVCHGDRNLVRVVGGQSVSLFVDTAVLESSAHATLLCTDCHVDFAYKTPHPTLAAGDEWRAIAKSSCKNCHRVEFLDWAKSVHSTAGTPGETSTVGAANSSAPGKPMPVCGDCHGGHAIPSKDDTAAMAAIHGSGDDMCGKCHTAAASSYDDYYHGAAYQRGAPDAPACWQCHNTHLVLPSANRDSWTNQDHLSTTCGQCHKSVGGGDKYTQYAQFVHRRDTTLAQNPIMEIANSARQAIDNVVYQVTHMFNKGSS